MYRERDLVPVNYASKISDTMRVIGERYSDILTKHEIGSLACLVVLHQRINGIADKLSCDIPEVMVGWEAKSLWAIRQIGRVRNNHHYKSAIEKTKFG